MRRNGVMMKEIEGPKVVVAGGGLLVGKGGIKPPYGARNSDHKYRVYLNHWAKDGGVDMNQVEHPHGGGSHQHIGHVITAFCDAPSSYKLGLLVRRRFRGQTTATATKANKST
ncbi:60S ribosomal protein L8-like [Camellia sinensis]|uniref:60S ribosomal protein L8-like n=1 Tax=Camellia sinensis TaxID=4442 RepID=UPI0010358E1E|nr:60S ribosomal protein L8-like [Camellia sinensis]